MRITAIFWGTHFSGKAAPRYFLEDAAQKPLPQISPHFQKNPTTPTKPREEPHFHPKLIILV